MSDNRPPAPSAPSKAPVVRLPTWVNVVLVLILLVSCGAAGDRAPSAEQIGNQVSERMVTGDGSAPSAQEVEDLCRLLGAIAVKQGVSVAEVMSKDQLTRCHQLALDPAAP